MRGEQPFSRWVFAAHRARGKPIRRPPIHVDTEVEYYLPTKMDRTIHTSSPIRSTAPSWRVLLDHQAGLTVTGAVATSTKTLRRAPRCSRRTDLAHSLPTAAHRPFSLLLDIVGAAVVYTGPFPPARSLQLHLASGRRVPVADHAAQLTVGARWMHVSNGRD